MNVSTDLAPIAKACDAYVGIAEQAECALIALAAVGMTGAPAIRIAASAAADAASRYNADRRAHFTQDYIPDDVARRLYERDRVISRLRALAAQPMQVAA